MGWRPACENTGRAAPRASVAERIAACTRGALPVRQRFELIRAGARGSVSVAVARGRWRSPGLWPALPSRCSSAPICWPDLAQMVRGSRRFVVALEGSRAPCFGEVAAPLTGSPRFWAALGRRLWFTRLAHARSPLHAGGLRRLAFSPKAWCVCGRAARLCAASVCARERPAVVRGGRCSHGSLSSA